MTIINLNKVHDLFVTDIRDVLNIHEKIELTRMLLNFIEVDYEKNIQKKYDSEKLGR